MIDLHTPENNEQNIVSTLSDALDDYKKVAVKLSATLIELRKAILSFNNKWLNRVLDEKLLLSEQLSAVKNKFEGVIISLYGSYSKEIAEQVQKDYLSIKPKWNSLKESMKLLKNNANDVRRVIKAVENYYQELNINYVPSSKKLYKPYKKR